MKKIVRLTENDLSRIVRRVIKEQNEDGNVFTSGGDGRWFDSDDMEIDEPTDYSEEITFGPDEYKSFMKFMNKCNTKSCVATKKMYDKYAETTGGFKVRR
jgi:hypothetical protein